MIGTSLTDSNKIKAVEKGSKEVQAGPDLAVLWGRSNRKMDSTATIEQYLLETVAKDRVLGPLRMDNDKMWMQGELHQVDREEMRGAKGSKAEEEEGDLEVVVEGRVGERGHPASLLLLLELKKTGPKAREDVPLPTDWVPWISALGAEVVKTDVQNVSKRLWLHNLNVKTFLRWVLKECLSWIWPRCWLCLRWKL